MNTTEANVAAVTADFQVNKHQALNLSTTQIKNKTVENRNKETSPVTFSKEAAQDMTEALNEYTENLNINYGFSIREDLKNQVVVEIKNKDTNETIKQFPPEEMLEIKQKMAELVGLIFDVKA